MLDQNKVAVISTGNGGQSLAAYLAFRGFETSLYAREQARVAMFPKDHLFSIEGVVNAREKVGTISNEMAEVIKDAHVIMVTTPTQYHESIAKQLAPCLQEGQIVVLNPGRTFGTYAFKRALEKAGCLQHIFLAEAETFIFACRCEQPGQASILAIKKNVLVAAHDPSDTPFVLSKLDRLFPESFQAARNIFETSFSNIGMIFHPLPVLLNITRVEKKEAFLYYKEGITPLVATILEELDHERLEVAQAYATFPATAFEWLNQHYGSLGETLYERIQNTEAYAHILAPTDLHTRYVFEDVQTGLVPMYFAGQFAGVQTPAILAAIQWASAVYQQDFLQKGRNDLSLDFNQIHADALVAASGLLPSLRMDKNFELTISEKNWTA